MNEVESSIATPPALAVDPGAPVMCVPGSMRNNFQALPQSYTESELWLYRDRTTGLLRRYLRMSVEVGRLPSLLGRELFRARVSAYHVTSFEEAVIFVRDVQRCLEKLDELDRKLLTRIIFQEYTHDEAAEMLGCWRRTIGRRYSEALDRLSAFLLNAGLLLRFPVKSSPVEKSCQEGETIEIPVSDSEQDE